MMLRETPGWAQNTVESGNSVPRAQLWLCPREYSEPWQPLSHFLGSVEAEPGGPAANNSLWLSRLGNLRTR